jgi:hypothetical protein
MASSRPMAAAPTFSCMSTRSRRRLGLTPGGRPYSEQLILAPADYGCRWPIACVERTSDGTNSTLKGAHNAQKNYERYLALAQAEVQAGDRVAAENYYQHAEHYFRSMSSSQE